MHLLDGDLHGRRMTEVLRLRQQGTITGIKLVFTVVPAVLIVVGMIALFFCNVDKIYPQIAAGLEEKVNKIK